MGLTHSPHLSAELKLTSGNFITARPLGVRDGVDFMHTGEVRRVDYHAIGQQLDNDAIVLISPLGYSPTGEIFNLSVEDVSTSVAIALKADKWLCLTETEEPLSQSGFLTLTEVEERLETGEDNLLSQRQLRSAIRACHRGVERVHVVQRRTDGGVFLELFSREGVGTMISRDQFEDLRAATIDDIAGIINLITPLERQGVLVPRPREKLETDIEHFIVQERDGAIIACAALMPYKEDNMAELACVAVNAQYKNEGRGDALLAFAIQTCQTAEINRLFVLTTRTAHWFQERGFNAAEADDLPMTKRALYNFQRNSKVFIKQL
jgi:amino-acid N-acetyltransferase